MKSWLITSAAITIIFIAVFFVPAYKRFTQQADRKSILAINTFLLWTLLGGALAFIWIMLKYGF